MQATSAAPQSVNLDAEASVLGSALTDIDALTAVADLLAPTDFYLGSHALIWDAIRALHDAQEPVDLITASRYLTKVGALDDIGGAAYLAELANAVHTTANVEHHAGIIVELARARRLGLELAQRIADIRSGVDTDEVAGRLRGYLDTVPDVPGKGADSLSPDELLALPETEFLIPGYLPQQSIAMLFGAPGSGKTFLAVRMAMSVAMGWHFRGRPVTETGLVYYVAAEGLGGLKKRAQAWQDHTSQRVENFWTHPGSVNLADHATVMAFLAKVRRLPSMPVLIVFDTLARCMHGVDENSAQETGQVIVALETIQRATGATILVLHHSTKANPEVFRGSSAIEGAVDASFYLENNKDTGIRTLKCIKLKEEDPFTDCEWELAKVGRSCVITAAGETQGEKVGGETPRHRRKLTPIEALLVMAYGTPEGLTKAEAARITEIGFSTVKMTTDRLFNMGLLKSEGAAPKRYLTRGTTRDNGGTTDQIVPPLSLCPSPSDSIQSPVVPDCLDLFPDTANPTNDAGLTGTTLQIVPPLSLCPSATPGGSTGPRPPYGGSWAGGQAARQAETEETGTDKGLEALANNVAAAGEARGSPEAPDAGGEGPGLDEFSFKETL